MANWNEEQTVEDVRDLERHRDLNTEWFAGQVDERDIPYPEEDEADE